MNEAPYNPLERRNLGASVAEALLERSPLALGAVPTFSGSGIYAIYYVGDFPLYRPVAEANGNDEWRWPIYVGKAVPSGAQKAQATSEGRPLAGRLGEHARSIGKVRNLDLADFFCRYLVVEDIWIPLGESLLIARFTPLWNRMITGFGNHTPGKGRFRGMRPRWDVLHPGRDWADQCEPRPETAEMIESEIAAYLRTAPVPPQHPKLLLDE